VTGATIREMTAGDIPPVMVIERSSFITPWTEGMFRSQLRFRDRAINLVLVENGTVAGYAAAWIAYDEIHLLSIAVAPAARRRGLGGEILGAVLERGKARGAVRAILEVREGNAAARAFYRMHGFIDIGTRRRYYSDTGEDAIIMEFVFEA
jgi:[ribosomal protein S18]-alanine N-acetyltransferase